MENLDNGYSPGVEIGEYRGQPIIQLPLPYEGRFFSFGLRKATTAKTYMEEIGLFVEGEGDPLENFVNVVVNEWKGHPILSLTMGNGFFRFGLTKAEVLLAHKEDVKLFVERGE